MAQKLTSDSIHCEGSAIIMPALNEEAVVGDIVRAIRQSVDIPVWLIDDCSTDRTVCEAKKAGARVISLHQRLGAWGATQTGFREATRMGLELVITMDADGQHDPKHIPAVIRPILERKCDVVIGSSPQRGSSLRRLAWKLMRFTSGLRCEDLTSGFRALNSEALSLLSGTRASHLDYQDVGVLLMLERAGLTINEVPVDMPPRRNGKSRIFSSWLAVASYMAQTLILGAFKRQRPRLRK